MVDYDRALVVSGIKSPPPLRRALVDWDFAASGLWHIRSIPVARSRTIGGPETPDARRSSPDSSGVSWNELLSKSLREDLRSWNDAGCSLARRIGVSNDDPPWTTFYGEGRVLAHRVQRELGDEWLVLWAARGAWHFVRFP